MSFRRSAALVAAAVALLSGCKKVSQEAPAQELVLAAFNSPVLPGSTTPALPTPNDLAMQAAPTIPVSAQRSLLEAFVAANGFPSDQAVGITVPLKRLTFDAATNAYVVATPPLVDPTTVTTLGATPTVVVMKVDVSPPTIVTIEVDVENCTTGQLALKKAKAGPAGSRAWAPGRYVFAVRGGANGVKTTTGRSVSPDQAIELVIPNLSFANPDNRPIGFPADQAARVEAVRQALWLPLDWSNAGGFWTPAPSGTVTPAFTAVSAVIPPEEIASIGAFEIAPAIPAAPVDSGSGIAPLPLDLLRTASSGTKIAFNPAFDKAAQGLTTLDGFSTTAMIFAPVTVPVDASTVNGSTVHLYKISGGTVTRLKELKEELAIYQATGGVSGDPAGAAYVAEPTPITTTQGNFLAPGVPCAAAGGCSLIVGLQPAVGAPTPLGTFYLPPLDEATDYAVFITTSVKDMLGRPLQKSTVAKILLDPGFDPVATSSVNGISLLSGISNDTATALRKMREQLVPVTAQLTTDTGKTAADVALAYTFRTQGKITSTALNLVGLPYLFGTGSLVDATFLSTSQVSALYGIDGGMLASPTGLSSIAEVKLTTSSLLLGSQNTGAFVDPVLNPTMVVPEQITALVALPDPSLVPSTCAHVAAFGVNPALQCAPLVVYAHGLANSKADMLPIAAALASRGFVVAAIDAEKHGERSYCTSDAQCCPAGSPQALAGLCLGATSTCVFRPNLTTPVDAAPFGLCEQSDGTRGPYLSFRSDFRTTALGCDPATDGLGNPKPACLSAKGNAFVNAQGFVSLNFFRVRDSIRQDVIDKSALMKALAPVPFASNAFSSELAARGLAVDPTKVYFVGHSFGAITGAASLAANPRIRLGVAYAPGATALDVFANPESRYNAILVGLLSGAGIAPGSPDFLKTLQIGKWILDPADPANFLSYALTGSLPVPLGKTTNSPFEGTALAAIWPAQPQRDALIQMSLSDGSVPNAQNTYYAARLGYPVPAAGSASTSSNVQWFVNAASGADPVAAKVNHSNLLDFFVPTLTQQAQSNAADFLTNPVGQAATVRP